MKVGSHQPALNLMSGIKLEVSEISKLKLKVK